MNIRIRRLGWKINKMWCWIAGHNWYSAFATDKVTEDGPLLEIIHTEYPMCFRCGEVKEVSKKIVYDLATKRLCSEYGRDVTKKCTPIPDDLMLANRGDFSLLPEDEREDFEND